MTEKRFELHYLFNVYDNDNEEISTSNEITDLLNKLHEENQALKKENQALKQSNENIIYILKKEYEFATKLRQKYLDDPILENIYNIVRCRKYL